MNKRPENFDCACVNTMFVLHPFADTFYIALTVAMKHTAAYTLGSPSQARLISLAQSRSWSQFAESLALIDYRLLALRLLQACAASVRHRSAQHA